jgi:hypothetical protein
MRARPTSLLLALAVALIGGQLPQRIDHVHAQQALPELSYICPMPGDEEVNEAGPGKCRKCGMELVPARIDLRYTCPTHSVIKNRQPGKCPLDGRELMPVTITMHWICKANPNQPLGDPGKCADGSARELVEQLRAHADHNPRHGGQFFMAADQWHHLEGTYPSANLFRLHMYDNFTQPFNVKGMTGRVVTREENGRELETFPLKPSRDGTALEAQLKGAQLPLKLAAKIQFDAKTKEQRFDFAFTELSKEPPAAPATTTTTTTTPARTAPAAVAAGTVKPAAPPTPAASTSAPSTSAPSTAAPAPAVASEPAAPMPAMEPAAAMIVADCKPNMSRADALLLSDNLPRNAAELISLLAMCSTEIETLIKDGQFGFIYQPTILSKDVAVALEDHHSELPDRQRALAIYATKKFVVAAWELDYYGDLGNREKITDTFNKYAAAAADIKAAYGAK